MTARRPAGSPASSGGQFAPARQPQAASFLDPVAIPSELPQYSPYRRAHTLEDLAEMHAEMTSPEVIWRDGEASEQDAKAHLEWSNREHQQRLAELERHAPPMS